MIYIVSGLPRSGTSIMMHALHKGGLNPVKFEEKEERLKQAWLNRGVEPPAFGFYHSGFSSGDLAGPRFAERYDEKVVKVFIHDLVLICPGNYRVVVMRRSLEDILDSRERAKFGHSNGAHKSNRPEVVERCLSRLLPREDMKITQLWLGDLRRNPIQEFSKLREAGWPIDPEKAAAVVKN